ncbi:hypothetical protein DFO70_11532 [Cytobacillus firmus]|uniref:Uncharacterized protein n=2 Tax=Cytobacillus TaxID=2675230 RepID=A0A366JMX1_CYTFI|nr:MULTISPECIES: hypothetical protein [Cytobacillus]RBP88263.1 hypothetical protein DFO70_11532 [Cytobacillus firmus]TDX38336.1 hypothetical protein DFO72_11332 [Cytobacillus oceanisediminis]
MDLLYAKVGAHEVEISTESKDFKNFIQRNFSIFKGKTSDPDIKITIKKGFGEPFVNYHVEVSKHEEKILFRRADYLIETVFDYRYSVIYAHNEFALKHAITNLYSSFIVYHNWGLLIHSSCAIENGKAHIFSGQSGAGKSTAAKLSAPRELLSDEATILMIDDGKVTVFDSPFRSELQATGTNKTVPLASIQLLHQSLHNNRMNLKKSDALIQLLDKVFYWAHSPKETKQVIKLLNKLVETVPVYDPHFQKNNRFWELIS